MPKYRERPGGMTSDSSTDNGPGRLGWYGDRYNLPLGASNWVLADEGSYFVGTNATLATGIAGHAAPVVADTDAKALLHLFNGGQRYIVPDFLFMEVTAAGTGGTIQYTTVYTDNKGATALSSGGTTITPVSTKSNSAITTGATVTFGACVTAMTASRKVGQAINREVIPVVQDTLLIVFGSANGSQHSALTTAGTATNHAVQYMPAVVIGPGGNLNISQIRPSQSAAASYQFMFGYFER